jgi:hypothetical protein
MNCDQICPYYSILAYMLKILLIQFVGFVNPVSIFNVATDTEKCIFRELRILLKVHSGQKYLL